MGLGEVFKDDLAISNREAVKRKHFGKEGFSDFVPSANQAIRQVALRCWFADLPGPHDGTDLVVAERHHLLCRPELVVRKPVCESRIGVLGIPALRVENRSEEHTSELQSRENLVCRL